MENFNEMFQMKLELNLHLNYWRSVEEFKILLEKKKKTLTTK